MANVIQGLLGRIDRGAWARFFIALAGLAVAFGAALFSTVFRQQGNVVATAIAASMALLAAGFVGLYTVPYLAKRVATEGFRDAFDYDVTREGLVYLAIALVIAVAALNTGNNLLFIIVAAMLSAVLVSGVASALVLRGLRLQAVLPAHVFARQAIMARVMVHNGFPVASFSVSVGAPKVKASKRFVWERGWFAFPFNRPVQNTWFRVPDLKLRVIERKPRHDAIFPGSVYFPYVPARSSVHADVELFFQRRGVYLQDEFGISTRFPFSFLRKTRRVRLQREIIVYPSVEATDELFQVLPMITGEFEALVAGRGHDLYRIREHQPGDSARLVDWKATAKSGALKVREFTREDERKLRLVFDNPVPGRLSSQAYESGVALAASLAWHFADAHTQLAFAAEGYAGSREVMDFLRYLALIEAREGGSVLDSLEDSGDYNIILTSRSRGSLPTRLWSSSYILYMQDK